MPSRGAPGKPVEDLSDEDLVEYVHYWRERGDVYRQLAAQLAVDDPAREQVARDGWWCSVKESAGLAEQEERRFRREDEA